MGLGAVPSAEGRLRRVLPHRRENSPSQGSQQKGMEQAMSTARVPMTREGYEKLKADLDRMAHGEMLEVAKRIAAARDLGDLSENAEYHAAREDQGMLQARIDALKDKLARAYIVDQSSLPKDTV